MRGGHHIPAQPKPAHWSLGALGTVAAVVALIVVLPSGHVTLDITRVALAALASVTLGALSKRPYGRVEPRRVTAQLGPGAVVFIIGASLNTPGATLAGCLWSRAHRKLVWSLMQMPKMIKEQLEHPQIGMLHAELHASVLDVLQGRPSTIIQYWHSKDHLVAFSRSTDGTHYPAWLAFNSAIRSAELEGTVGIYHETFVVESSESIYRGIPEHFGVVAAARQRHGVFGTGSVVAVDKQLASAEQRLGNVDPAIGKLEGHREFQ